MVNENIFSVQVPENFPLWLKEVFLSDLRDSEIEAYKEALKKYYVSAIDFFQSKKINISRDNVRIFKDEIVKHIALDNDEIEPKKENEPKIASKNANIDTPKKKCACHKIGGIESDVKQLRKFGIVAIIVVALVLIFK